MNIVVQLVRVGNLEIIDGEDMYLMSLELETDD
jgi:hypothetical protein